MSGSQSEKPRAPGAPAVRRISTRNVGAAAAAATAAAPSLQSRFDSAAQSLAERGTPYAPAVAAEPGSTSPAGDTTATDDKGRPVRFARIPTHLVDPNPFNARRIYESDKIAALATSMRAEGQMVPCIGTMRNGRCITIAGHYRYKAINAAKIETVEFKLYENLTDRELYEMSYRENADRQAQTALDNALVWRDLLDQGIYPDQTALAAAVSQSLPNVNKTMAILDLPEPVLELVRATPSEFALSALYELNQLAKVAPLDQTVAMAQKLATGDAGRKECAELRGKFANPQPRKARTSSRQYRILHGGGQNPIGTLKEWDAGKIVLDLQVPDPTKRTAIVAQLKTLFEVSD